MLGGSTYTRQVFVASSKCLQPNWIATGCNLGPLLDLLDEEALIEEVVFSSFRVMEGVSRKVN